MSACINDSLTDDELRSVFSKLISDKDKEVFGLVCKRWLRLQSIERKRLAARAGPHMLKKMASRFSRVVELDLSQSVSRSFYPGVTDSDLVVIANGFRCLKVLNLQNCKGITDNGMTSIGNGLSSLQSLDVSYCRKVTDKGLFAVASGCRDLRSLHLAGCRFVGDKLMKALSENCPNLEELGVQGCTNITDDGVTDLVSGCCRIKFLDFNKCNNVGDIGISNVSKACSSLKTLKLLDCYKVGDESIFSLAGSCNDLETLIIGGCRNVSDESINSLAKACNNSLKKLRMDWCLNISDASLICILSNCRKLEALDIGCCDRITDAAFQGLTTLESELELKVLKISNCPGISITGITILLEKCTSLEYLDVRSCPAVTKSICEEAGLHFPDCCKVNFTGSLNEPDFLV